MAIQSTGRVVAFALATAWASTQLVLAEGWLAAGAPVLREKHAMAYDSTRGHVVLFGGRYNANPSSLGSISYFGDTWEWDGNQWTWQTSSGPSPRFGHKMAYDSARGRMVLFGGENPEVGKVGGTWEWDGHTWILRTNSGPLARSDHAMVYDAARGRVVLFGGHRSSGGFFERLGDTWEWDGNTWTQRASTGPSARDMLAMAYDAGRGRVVLFGGYSSGYKGDTWEWDGTTWTLRASSGPSPRAQHAMAYDATRARVLLFGGNVAPSYSAETWEWDGTTWTLRASSGPATRIEHAIAYDATRARVVLFGGSHTINETLGDTWEWNGTTWAQMADPGPTPRFAHAMVYDSARESILLFGGARIGSSGSTTTLLGDFWGWDGAAWSPESSGPNARQRSAMAFDAGRGRAVLFGGSGSGGVLGETWEWNGGTWSVLFPSVPQARREHAMVFDAARGRVLLFGGVAGNTLFGDTWEWNGTTWTLRASSGPPARRGHTMAYDALRDRTVLFGGIGQGSSLLGDTWEWDGNTWTQRASSGPLPRSGHAMAYHKMAGRVVLFGGAPLSFLMPPFGDTWEWDGSTWIQRAFLGPSSREAVAMAYDSMRGRIVLFGGQVRSEGAAGARGDTWEYEGCNASSIWYRDVDEDGFGDPGVTSSECAPPGYVADGTDCNDGHALVHPGAFEYCDALDNDCDGTIDDDAVPGPIEDLMFADHDTLVWTPSSTASSYDVVKGDVRTLTIRFGDFIQSLLACVENDSADASSVDAALPAPGSGFYYLVRAFGCTRDGTYDDSSASQRDFRDEEIQMSPAHCP